MQFDIRTLLVAIALATAFCAAARFLLWRMHPHVPGLSQWAWAGLLATCALFLFAGRGVLHDTLSLSLAQLVITAGLLLAWDGFRRFLGRAPLAPLRMAAPLALLAALVAISHLQSSLTLYSLANALIIGSISALIGRELLCSPSHHSPVTRVTAYVYLANAAFFAVRGASALTADSSIGTPVATGITAWTLLWWLCVTVALTLGMTLMTSERLQADLDRQASRDPLTGALNRRAFAQLAEKELARVRRNGRPLSVAMMDLDHFKRINDQMGHAAGDDILCRFVTVAGTMLRGEDAFCRFGGEEFVALLPDTSSAQALAAAERLRQSFAESAADIPRPAHVPAFSVSIGIAELAEEETMENALRRADAALYAAKAAGRDRCELAPPHGLASAMAGA